MTAARDIANIPDNLKRAVYSQHMAKQIGVSEREVVECVTLWIKLDYLKARHGKKT